MFDVTSATERARIAEILREETVGGALLVVAAAVALVWANSPWSGTYVAVRDARIGPEALHLNLTLFYTDDLDVVMLGLSLSPIAVFGVLVQRRVRSWWLLIPLAVVAWGLMHEAGVHATVAGVLLALTVPVVRSEAAGGPDAGPGLAEHFEHRLRPLSAGAGVPIFALLAAGVAVGGLDGLGDALSDPIAYGVIAGLVLGKVVGITAAAAAVARFTRAELDERLSWADIVGIALLGGVGFTVSLLIGELAYDATRLEHVKVGVLAGSLLAAALAAVILRRRERAYRRAAA